MTNAWTESVRKRVLADRALQELPAKKLVGRDVRLLHKIETGRGAKFRKGQKFRVYGTWRGKFHLEPLNSLDEGGIRHVDRSSFEVIA